MSGGLTQSFMEGCQYHSRNFKGKCSKFTCSLLVLPRLVVEFLCRPSAILGGKGEV